MSARTLKGLRKQAGWTRIDLATAMGIEPEEILQFENGLERIPPHLLIKLTKILQVDIVQIFEGVAGRKPTQNEGDSNVDENPEISTLLHHFRRIRDPKTRTLIVSLIAVYAENESTKERE